MPNVLPAPPEDRQKRRTASLSRLRDAARADGLSPTCTAELEGSLMGAFAIKDLMAAVFGGGRDD